MQILDIRVGGKYRAMLSFLIKDTLKKPLTIEQKTHNKELAFFRIRVENKIREIKTFKIILDVYRNFQRNYHMRFNGIDGLVNLKCGF